MKKCVYTLTTVTSNNFVSICGLKEILEKEFGREVDWP